MSWGEILNRSDLAYGTSVPNSGYG